MFYCPPHRTARVALASVAMASRDDQLRDVLGNNVHRNSFLDFCKREHCAENLQFYNAICEFEAADNDDDRAAMVRHQRRRRLWWWCACVCLPPYLGKLHRPRK